MGLCSEGVGGRGTKGERKDEEKGSQGIRERKKMERVGVEKSQKVSKRDEGQR